MIPSLYTARIEFRPATVVAEQIQQLHQMLSPVHQLPITLQSVSQRVFMEKCVESAKIVLFTGAYANAERIKTHINSNRQMYVFLGQGVNPIIITETADLDEAVTGVITARLFNTGQDCMGPDVIFVQQGVARPFLDTLGDKLVGLTFGSRKDPNADYSPIYYSSTIEVISQYMSRNGRYISYGGAIDYAKKKIEPTVLFSSLRDKPEIIEFFGPVFNVVSYDDEEALKYELSQNFYRERAMGASLYGGGSLIDFLKLHHSVSVNATLFEIEDGNKPFGGYGPMANYVYCNKQLKAEPILLSQIVSDYL
jgi:aldehyde dehydrogenase (NAD+)